MDFLGYWKAIKPRLDEGCDHWIPEFSRDLPTEYRESIRQTLEDGKRIRGCLVCLISDALGGKLEEAIPRAVAIECIQAASLIHDDYVDQDILRRNRPATWTVEGSRRAVLLGDVIFATAIQKMTEMSRRDGSVIAQAIATMAKGAYQEPLNPSDLALAIAEGRYQPGLYNLIIHLKTGALFGAASKLGAIAAGASAGVTAHAFEFGARVGEAYQIADDLQEVLKLDGQADNLLARISMLAPIFLYFSHETKSHVLRLLEKREEDCHQWIEKALPVLQTRMEHEVAIRLDLAIKEIKDFPDNPHTRMLYTAPSKVIRMILETNCTDDPSHPKEIPISGR